MNKVTFAAAAAASSGMNQKPPPTAPTTTITSQIAVVHLSSGGASNPSSATSNGKANSSVNYNHNNHHSSSGSSIASGVHISTASLKPAVTRNGGPGVPPKPSMISYRNGLSSGGGDRGAGAQESVKSASIKVNQHVSKQSDHSDKSLTDDSAGSPVPPDARAKQVLKEAVNAVVNSFAKHSQGGYGRGEYPVILIVFPSPTPLYLFYSITTPNTVAGGQLSPLICPRRCTDSRTWLP